MRKLVLVLSASPRKQGNSDLLCDQFLKGATEVGHATERIQLRDMRITPCTGCGICDTPGSQCAQTDDMPLILERMIRADVLVMATPVYFYSVSGQMKTFIDRTCSRYKDLIDKEFYFILSAADPSQAAIESAIEPFRGFLSCLQGPRLRGVVYGVGAWEMGAAAKTAAYWQALDMGRSV